MNDGSRPVILFYVQHLLGIGHVFRATRIARAMAKAGMSVHMVWGGTRLPSIDLAGIEMTWLEPVRAANSDFDQLLDQTGRPASAALLEDRRQTLLNMLDRIRPDIVITEAFPFGRSQMQFELVPFMTAVANAAWRPMAVASIRDIMTENRKQRRARESIDWAKAWYDLVLVHGDPNLLPIEATLQYAAEIEDKIRYTGLVTPDPVDRSQPPSMSAQIVVSAGGGAVGHALTAATIGANEFSKRFPDDWLLIVGPERPEAEFLALKRRSGKGLRVERFVPDLTHVMAAATVSVSRAGYNTVGDVMRAGCRSVLAPYEGGRETEQARRAAILAGRGHAIMVADADLSPESLADAVDRAAHLPPMQVEYDLDGAKNAADILLRHWQKLMAH